jgi:hypothetical protein
MQNLQEQSATLKHLSNFKIFYIYVLFGPNFGVKPFCFQGVLRSFQNMSFFLSDNNLFKIDVQHFLTIICWEFGEMVREKLTFRIIKN